MADADVTTAAAGAEAVAVWFDRHARALATYAARRVGATVARDIVAETFRVACEQLDQFDPQRGDERAWLFGIATNLMRRHFRAEERRLRIQARSISVGVTPSDPLLRVDERLDAQHRFELVVDAVALLDPDDRDLLFLVAWEEMTSGQAAHVLGIPAGTVRSRLSRIRAHLTQTVREGDRHG